MILDSCILIDVSRNNRNAVDYLEGLQSLPAISVVTMTEVLSGVRNKRESRLFEALFAQWRIIPLDVAIAREAGDLLSKYQASHGTDIIDAIIAATAIQHQLDLITLNLKHFPMFENLKRPY